MEVRQGGLRATEWEILPIEAHRDAVAAIESWHYAKSAPNTSTCRFGLFRRGDSTIRGVSLWLPPTKPAAVSVAGEHWRGVLALSRFVIEPDLPTNAASFLLGRSMKMIDRQRWHTLVTYADTGMGHTGTIYQATNWECDGERAAGDVWIGPDGERRGRKRGKFNYSAQQMRDMGFTKAPNLPKIRYVHRRRRTT